MAARDRADLPVLLIEPDAALRRVMAVGLRRRGVRVVEAPSLGTAWEMTKSAPAVVVLDIGLGPESEWVLLRALRRHRVLSQAPLVVLAWECPTPTALGEGYPLRGICLTKPFDARALYRAVEDALRVPERTSSLAPVPVEAAPLIAADRAPRGMPAAPSVWPLVTAAGAALALMGLLIHVALVVAGVAILLVAVLLWSGEAGEIPESAATPL